MDFNTGGGTGGTASPGGSSGGTGGAPPRMTGGTGGEFDYRDPVQSFVRTVTSIVTSPAAFFRGIRRRGDFINPLVFAVICAVISGVLSGIIGFLIALVTDSGAGAAFGGLIGSIFLIPIGTVIGLFIGAGIYYLVVMLLVRPNSGFEATFRVVAYGSVVSLVSWLSAIPVLGVLVALVVAVYGIFLAVVGIREVHATTTGRAVAVVLIPTAVVFLFLLLLFGAALLVFMGTQQ